MGDEGKKARGWLTRLRGPSAGTTPVVAEHKTPTGSGAEKQMEMTGTEAQDECRCTNPAGDTVDAHE